jgi:hypothetical protein
MQGDTGKAFESYARLQSETYEFISRSIATHNWLEEAYRVVKGHPQLGGEDLLRACQPAFDRIYTHLFSPLLRSYRMMAFPFAESLVSQLASRTGGVPPASFTDSVMMLAQWQGAYYESLAGTLQQLFGFGLAPSGNSRRSTDDVDQVTPLRLLAQASDRQAETYFGTIGRWLVSLGENQFVFPKPLILNLQKAVTLYPRLHAAATGYETMLYDAWQASMRRFTVEAANDDRGMDEFKEFFSTYRSTLTEEFSSLLRRPEFIKAQTDFVEVFSEFIVAVRKAGEAQVAMFPALPLVTTAQMEALARNLHSYRKRLDGVERRLRPDGDGANDALRIRELERRITELERMIRRPAGGAKRTSGKRRNPTPKTLVMPAQERS